MMKSTMAAKTKPSKPTKRKVDHAGEALALLDVTEDKIREVPRIEHLFKAIGGKLRVMEFLEGSEEPEARKVVELRAKLSQLQAKAVPFEAYCIAAGVTTKKMFGVIAQEVAEQSSLAMTLLSKARRTDVVKAAIDAAVLPLGSADRKLVLQAEGYAPVPKTNVTNIHGNVDNRTQTANVAVLPPVEDSVRRLSDRFNTMEMPAMLPAAEIIENEDEDGD